VEDILTGNENGCPAATINVHIAQSGSATNFVRASGSSRLLLA
jgi:hypothetical protein